MKKLSGVIVFFIVSVNLVFGNDKPYSINGDVRVKSISNWQDDYDYNLKCEATISANYSIDDTWMKGQLKVSNPFAEVDFDYTQFDMQQLLIGYRFFENNSSELFIEAGRNKLENIFDSKVQFGNYFNGFNLNYNLNGDNYKLSIHGGPHIISSYHSYWGYIGEVCLTSSPFVIKYSLANWTNASKNDINYDYFISQVLCNYQVSDKVNVYWAYLLNHQLDHNNNGFYIGAQYGQIKKANDWTFDANYQYLETNAVPQFDQAGIGKGIQAKLAYAVTDNFHLQAKFNTKKNAEFSAIYRW